MTRANETDLHRKESCKGKVDQKFLAKCNKVSCDQLKYYGQSLKHYLHNLYVRNWTSSHDE